MHGCLKQNNPLPLLEEPMLDMNMSMFCPDGHPWLLRQCQHCGIVIKNMWFQLNGLWIFDTNVDATSTTILLSHNNSLMFMLRTTMSASVVDNDVSPCSLDCQMTGQFPTKITNPVLNFEPTRSLLFPLSTTLQNLHWHNIQSWVCHHLQWQRSILHFPHHLECDSGVWWPSWQHSCDSF